MNRFLDYFNDANKNKKHKKFDFSVIGGPHYSTDTELGLGLVEAGVYRTCQTDTLLPPSNVSLYGDFSTVGFYLLGIRGTNIFPQDKYRLTYTVYFFSFPSYTWGMGYDMGNIDDKFPPHVINMLFFFNFPLQLRIDLLHILNGGFQYI